MEDKGDKPTVPFRAREGRVKVAVFVLGLVLLFIGLIGALYGWFVASGLEATHAFTCAPVVRRSPIRAGARRSCPRRRRIGPSRSGWWPFSWSASSRPWPARS